jgi:peptide/nickel transport system substrate-binding protein
LSAVVLALALRVAPAGLVVGTLADPALLEPHRSNDLVAAEILANVCEPLVRLRPGSLRVEGVLATAWATTDQRVWTFTLREGVRFQDGSPFDADTVVANLEELRRERVFRGRGQRVGPHVVQVSLERADAALLPTLSQPQFAMRRPGRGGAEGAAQGPPVGTGPFIVHSVQPGLVELVAFPGYWGGSPRLGRLSFRRFADPASLVLALENGSVDVSSAVGPAEVPALRARADLALDSQTGQNLVYLAVNDARPPLSDPRVRQALSRAIDRQALVRLVGGHAEAANGPLPPALLGRDARQPRLRLDRESARRLLGAAHWRQDGELTLTVSSARRPYLSEPLALASRIRDDLAAVGVLVRLHEAASWREQVTLTARGEYDLALLGWRADTLDPNDFLTALLDSSSIGSTNRSRYRSAAMDSLLKRARRDGSPHARQTLYHEALELFRRDMPFVPLLHASSFTVHRRDVVGLVIGPTGILRFDKAWKQD